MGFPDTHFFHASDTTRRDPGPNSKAQQEGKEQTPAAKKDVKQNSWALSEETAYYDQRGVCATDDAAFARQIWDKGKPSTKTIAILVRKDTNVGHSAPRP